MHHRLKNSARHIPIGRTAHAIPPFQQLPHRVRGRSAIPKSGGGRVSILQIGIEGRTQSDYQSRRNKSEQANTIRFFKSEHLQLFIPSIPKSRTEDDRRLIGTQTS
ncbi:hypothetical protein LXL04_007674 [Taraxacum kok-saghyz]